MVTTLTLERRSCLRLAPTPMVRARGLTDTEARTHGCPKMGTGTRGRMRARAQTFGHAGARAQRREDAHTWAQTHGRMF